MFLKILGVNTLLGLCGMPVYASQFEMPFIEYIGSHSGISDSLEHGVSSFGRELMRLNHLTNRREKMRSLILCDELFQCVSQDIGEKFLSLFINYINQRYKKTYLFVSTHHEISEMDNCDDVTLDHAHKLRNGKLYNSVFDIWINGRCV